MGERTRKLADLSDNQLMREGDSAVRRRHDLAVRVLDCLVEIEGRSLHLREGYSSLFDFCVRRWGYSPPKAGRSIASARCVKSFPAVRGLLVKRKITVCGVAKIAGILTEKNAREVLGRVSGMRYVEIERLVAAQRSAPPVREFVRPIGVKSRAVEAAGTDRRELFASEPPTGTLSNSTSSGNHSQFESDNKVVTVAPGPTPTPGSDPCAAPLPEERFEIRFSAGKEFIRKLERAKAVCSRCAGLEAIMEKALDELLDRTIRSGSRREGRKGRRERTGLGGRRGRPQLSQGSGQRDGGRRRWGRLRWSQTAPARLRGRCRQRRSRPRKRGVRRRKVRFPEWWWAETSRVPRSLLCRPGSCLPGSREPHRSTRSRICGCSAGGTTGWWPATWARRPERSRLGQSDRSAVCSAPKMEPALARPFAAGASPRPRPPTPGRAISRPFLYGPTDARFRRSCHPPAPGRGY